MLAFCPLRVAVIHRNGETRVLFARPTAIAGESPARGVLEEVERAIVRAIDSGVAQARQGGSE
jgi:hypothetical protein